MADRHTIVVRINDGKVSDVLFCDCCPGLTLEIRTYAESSWAALAALSAPHEGGPSAQQSQFKRDEVGVYEASYYEPDVADD